MTSDVSPDPGSFRDPLSRVFVTGDTVLRGFRGAGVADFEAYETSQFAAEAAARGDIVGSERVDSSALPGDYDVVVRHERIPLISYPYEWTFSMLRDAALLQLRLTRQALAEGLITKDATPFNIQFVGTRPRFIDVGSFERIRSGEPWAGYRQFCTMMLNPLLLQAHNNVPFQPWLRGSIDGISPTDMARLLSRRDRWRRGTLGHVTLHARAERKLADSTRNVAGELKKAGFGPAIVDAQLKNLTATIERLEWKETSSTWSSYVEREHYTDVDLEQKADFVRDVVGREHRKLVWDLGANDGFFTRIAAESSDYVVAVDSDALVIDRLYRTLRTENDTKILPLVMDLIDSTPALGWRSKERAAFYQRSSPDVVLALALVHHLAIPGTVPIGEIVDWLAAMRAEVVLEVPHADDEKVVGLLRFKRSGLFDHYTIEAFDASIRAAFDVRKTLVLPSGTRTIYHLAPRS